MPRWSHVVVHHSWTGDSTLADTVAIRNFHTAYRQWGNIITEDQYYALRDENAKGLVRPWQDIGYHWLVERLSDSRPWVIKGRSMMKHGAHCRDAGMNRKGIGVCVVGNFDIAPPPEDIFEETADFVAWLCRMYRIPVDNVHGHRDFANKSCPGEKFDMAYFRERVTEYLEVWTPSG
jgi:N-acetyl-anhydromuramyl-L-alanine amidase AmpD